MVIRGEHLPTYIIYIKLIEFISATITHGSELIMQRYEDEKKKGQFLTTAT